MSTDSTPRRVSVVLTVRNDPAGAALVLDSLAAQSRPPDEIVVVDGGSTDDTLETLRRYAAALPVLRIIEDPGANIAAGRNRAVREATGQLIAVTDAGCRARPDWLANLIRPFENDPDVDFVAGFYRVTHVTLLEQVIALSTMRGQLDNVNPYTFNPSARSLALTRDLWRRAGGWPQWLDYSEDTWFDLRVRRLGARWVFARDAVVDWRPRSSLRALAKQFYRYGTGRGQTGIDAHAYRYNLRNLALILATLALALSWPWVTVITMALTLYFGWFAHHPLAIRIARRTRSPAAYGLCLAVQNVVAVAGAAGYLAGGRRRAAARSTESAPPADALVETCP